MLTAAPAVFDVCGELPSGTTVLEASAGTGKTFTIAALAARYVAEGHASLPELMLVTFGREATQELRERVRERLVSAERGLAAPAAARAGGDRVLALLAAAPDEEVARRRRRLADALAHFDAATIATTHQFCQRMLDGLGVAGDTDPGAVFVESVDDLLTEVVDDFYVRKYAPGEAERPAFSRETALAIARRAVADFQARLEPRDAPAGSAAHVRQAFAGAVRAEVRRRKLRAGVYTYDDMLSRLRDTLADPVRGPGACARLRSRYRTVLVDEFQDTDPVQWEILQRAFSGQYFTHSVGSAGSADCHPPVTLVLIGDPKQAIYAFRGADVVSYLDAVGSADHHATLGVNWRSDGPLLSALERVFGGVALGDERIVAHPVKAARAGRRLVGAPGGAPLRLRVVPRDGLPATPRSGLAVVGPARQRVAADLAADITALLAGGARLDGRAVAPGDVAVLVRTNDQAGLVHEALAAAGVPAVLTGSASVFAAPVAAQWLTLLEAVEQPQRAARVRAAALTCFLGRTVEELCGADAERLLDELGATLRRWAAALQERGVAALLEAVTTGTGLPARLLARTDGERTLTDLRHIGQALHRAAVEGHLGPGALVEWLRHRIVGAAEDTGSERSRRLESDAAAVQIVTVHRSKGCEFGIVYVPFGWDRYTGEPEVALLHELGTRVLDVGGPGGEGWRERCERHRAEEAGEDLRLLYVAMTRARCQVVTWWVPASTTAGSPLHRLLFGGADHGTPVAASYRVPADTAALAALRALASPELAVEEATERAPGGWSVPRGPTGRLAAAGFGRRIDTAWRRTSYSALTAASHAAPASSEPEEPGTDDEPAPDGPGSAAAGDPEAPVAALPSPMAALPVGTAFGTLVHAVLEAADPTAADLTAELGRHAGAQLAARPTPGVEPDALAAALVPVVETPLGALAGGLRLRDIAPADRLAELEFELPLAGGDAAGRHGRAPAVEIGALAPQQRRHLPAGDPLAGYAELLAAPPLAEQPLRGYLTGSIDAVLRLPGPRFLVVDYKTNWLGPVGPDGPEPLTTRHYRPGRLARAMIAAHYPLQALVYAVALHRFLRWRQPGYTARQHLGGVLYLFLRGMSGAETPVVDGAPCGVFGWAPPPPLVEELSRLLDGEAP